MKLGAPSGILKVQVILAPAPTANVPPFAVGVEDILGCCISLQGSNLVAYKLLNLEKIGDCWESLVVLPQAFTGAASELPS